MSHAYTPGLRVTPRAVIRKPRLLPIPGEVLVTPGQRVTSASIVARTHLPGKVHSVNVVNLLGVSPSELRTYMLKQEGDPVERDEPLAENRPLLKWFRTRVPSPIRGTVESISAVTGQVLLREPAVPLEVQAYVDGQVVEVTPGQGAVVETTGALVQGIFGVGGETAGPLAMGVERPEERLTPERLRPEHRGAIVIGGALVTRESFARAREIGVRAIICGGLHDPDLRVLLGHDLGVAITGMEPIGFTLIVTEGFGSISMARRTFDLLAAHAGHKASCNGATQIRAGVIRPEVIIPQLQETASEAPAAPPSSGLQAGDLIRLIREPYFGLLARVRDLPQELVGIATESRVRVLVAELPDGTLVTVPRANVEIIQG